MQIIVILKKTERYLTSRLMAAGVNVKPNDDFSVLEVSVNYTLSKRFLQRKKNITDFRITLIFLFPDFKNNDIVTIPVVLPDKALTDSTSRSFVVDIPRRANSWLVCFKAEACRNGAIYQNTSHVDKAMSLIASGMRD